MRFVREIASALLPIVVFATTALAQSPPAPSTATLRLSIEKFLSTTKRPLTLQQVKLLDAITSDNLNELATQIVKGITFVDVSDETPIVKRLVDADLSTDRMNQISRQLIAAGLIRAGFFTVLTEWKTTNGQPFSTIATIDRNGTPKFEPIMYFSTSEVREVNDPPTIQGSWTSGPYQRTILNGFGITCVDVEWYVRIQTDRLCNITDPQPHIMLTKALSNCALWKQETLIGESPWCSALDKCGNDCGASGTKGEECIKWLVATFISNGLTNINVDLNVGAPLRGVTVNGKVDFSLERFGNKGEFVDTGNLCANSGRL